MAKAGCLLLALMLSGCGGGPVEPRAVPVTGTVYYRANPVTSGEITFAPVDAKGQAAQAIINKDGSFVAKLSEAKPGLLPGEYKVTIISHKRPLDQIPPSELAKLGDGNLAIPKKYTDQTTTNLTLSITVKDRSKHADFELED